MGKVSILKAFRDRRKSLADSANDCFMTRISHTSGPEGLKNLIMRDETFFRVFTRVKSTVKKPLGVRRTRSSHAKDSGFRFGSGMGWDSSCLHMLPKILFQSRIMPFWIICPEMAVPTGRFSGMNTQCFSCRFWSSQRAETANLKAIEDADPMDLSAMRRKMLGSAPRNGKIIPGSPFIRPPESMPRGRSFLQARASQDESRHRGRILTVADNSKS